VAQFTWVWFQVRDRVRVRARVRVSVMFGFGVMVTNRQDFNLAMLHCVSTSPHCSFFTLPVKLTPQIFFVFFTQLLNVWWAGLTACKLCMSNGLYSASILLTVSRRVMSYIDVLQFHPHPIRCLMYWQMSLYSEVCTHSPALVNSYVLFVCGKILKMTFGVAQWLESWLAAQEAMSLKLPGEAWRFEQLATLI